MGVLGKDATHWSIETVIQRMPCLLLSRLSLHSITQGMCDPVTRQIHKATVSIVVCISSESTALTGVWWLPKMGQVICCCIDYSIYAASNKPGPFIAASTPGKSELGSPGQWRENIMIQQLSPTFPVVYCECRFGHSTTWCKDAASKVAPWKE